MPAATLAYLPSPHSNVWHLGPIPIRAYALCIIAGIVAAVWIGERRWVARGGRRGTVSDVAVWAVVFGLAGGRLYHVVTDWQLYFGAGKNPWRAFQVWEGGLGIWGAISLGGVGAWIGCRRRGIKLPPYADAVAPGIAVAQAIGRWGNWFNQELFGKPTTLPWGLKIDPGRPNTVPGAAAYHPTFLYESLWDLGLAGALVLADRRFKLGRGRVFALYVMGYTAGRVWIEMLRIDTANTILGLRLNVWTSIVVFIGGLIYFLRHPGPRETEVEPSREPAPAEAGSAAEPGAESDGNAGEAVAVRTGAGEDGAEGTDEDDPDPTVVVRTGAGDRPIGEDSAEGTGEEDPESTVVLRSPGPGDRPGGGRPAAGADRDERRGSPEVPGGADQKSADSAHTADRNENGRDRAGARGTDGVG